MAMEHARTGTLPPQRENADYNADKLNAILPALMAHRVIHTACKPLDLKLGGTADRGEASPEGVLQSWHVIAKTLTCKGNKQGERRHAQEWYGLQGGRHFFTGGQTVICEISPFS
jgi:hypothetical protein